MIHAGRQVLTDWEKPAAICGSFAGYLILMLAATWGDPITAMAAGTLTVCSTFLYIATLYKETGETLR